MHNWWIAALEHAGIWTREQAEHVSKEIKTSIHRENYQDAFNELGAILNKGHFDKPPVVTQLKSDIKTAKKDTVAEIIGLKKEITRVETGLSNAHNVLVKRLDKSRVPFNDVAKPKVAQVKKT
jgi:hypothetical protein